jgi:hypothetical protein
MASVSEWDRAGLWGLEASGVVVSSDAGSGCGALRACVVGVGGGDFVGDWGTGRMRRWRIVYGVRCGGSGEGLGSGWFPALLEPVDADGGSWI